MDGCDRHWLGGGDLEEVQRRRHGKRKLLPEYVSPRVYVFVPDDPIYV
jgi:hypothetical protein